MRAYGFIVPYKNFQENKKLREEFFVRNFHLLYLIFFLWHKQHLGFDPVLFLLVVQIPLVYLQKGSFQ